MIPNIIHHIWINPLQGHAAGNIPQDVEENLRAWQAIEPRYSQKIWSLNEIFELCEARKLSDTAKAIQACRFPSMQADIGRLLLLSIFGGFWADLKLQVNCRFLDRLIGYDLVLTEHFVKEDLPDPNGRLSNSFIGAMPGNCVIDLALKFVVGNVNRRMPGSIYHITGATCLETALTSCQENDRHFMLPHGTAWNYLFTIRGGSYNGLDMHWSLREKRESPFNEN